MLILSFIEKKRIFDDGNEFEDDERVILRFNILVVKGKGDLIKRKQHFNAFDVDKDLQFMQKIRNLSKEKEKKLKNTKNHSAFVLNNRFMNLKLKNIEIIQAHSVL